MRNLILPAAITLLIAAASRLPGALVINMQEVGADVVVTASGSLDMTGAVFQTSFNNTDPRQLLRARADLLRQYALGNIDAYSLTGGTHDLGDGGNNRADSILGDTYGINGNDTLYVPGGYAGGPLSGSSIILGKSIAGMGFIPGSYTWTIPSDSITLNIGAVTPVPEPATYIALAGFGGLGALVWRRCVAKRKATSVEAV
ncbi:PEP-CTERM sorting domain-containing protein [Cerasicoccus maritimus]|uniref:PEP-CTERM sorting domain-containing protein n=1 Tax=Cerasicoccus maritimus TaxID=490089 RepID=UPI002852D5EF|nr:PEP-CTERM sorting domain-containing protein [Cerasicoccus maritimus]